MSHVNVLFFWFQGYSDIRESTLPWKNWGFDIWYSPATFRHSFSFGVYAAPFLGGLLIRSEKNLWITNRRFRVYIFMLVKEQKIKGLFRIILYVTLINRRYFSGLSPTQNWSAHVLLGEESGNFLICSCWEKGNFIKINGFKNGQTWKIWPSPLSLSL